MYETTGKLLERKASFKIILKINRETIANGSLTFTSAITVFRDVTTSNQSRLRSQSHATVSQILIKLCALLLT